MPRIYSDNSFSIGGTPLVRLNNVAKNLPGIVLGKVEGRNPSYSGEMAHRCSDDLGRGTGGKAHAGFRTA